MGPTATTSQNPTGKRSCRGSTRSCASAGRSSTQNWGSNSDSDSLRLCTKAGYSAEISRFCAQKLHQRLHWSSVEERHALEQVAGESRGGWQRLRREGSPGRMHLERWCRVLQTGEASRLRQRRVEAAQLIHQLALQRLRAGPHLAAGEGLNLATNNTPRGGDDVEEHAVRAVDHRLHDLALLRRVWILVALHHRASALSDGLAIDQQLGPEPTGDELSGQHAYRTGQRARPRDDPASGRRDPVAA